MCACPKSRQMPTLAARRVTSSTKCTSEPARDSSFGITSTRDLHAERLGQPLQLLDAAPRRRRGCCRSPRRCCVRGKPEVRRPARRTGIRRAICSARSASAIALRARLGVGARERQRRTPAAARRSSRRSARARRAARGRPRPATAAGRRPPPGCGSRSASASRTARPRSNPCAAISSRCSRRQPLAVVEVRRDPELTFASALVELSHCRRRPI